VTGADTVAQLQALRHDACVVSACGDAPRAAVGAYERLGVAVMTPEPRTAVPAAA
jgi:hypothetical protein